MKGEDVIKAFLSSGKDLSACKDALPHQEVDREALIKVLVQLHLENLALKANMPSESSEASTSALSAAAISEQMPSKLSVAANPFEPSAQEVVSAQKPEEKPEKDKLCPSMWGVKPCPGRSTCVRTHLTLCNNPTCFSNEDQHKACSAGPNGKWHGHVRAAIRAEKKRMREVTEKREFLAWKKQGNGKPPSGRGIQIQDSQKSKES